ncbi:MAG: hypothetical protein FWH06_02550 [Oscillospiraceae bacterium]|nr:hypothetical protein [Oscillospiraceae bacterium]
MQDFLMAIIMIGVVLLIIGSFIIPRQRIYRQSGRAVPENKEEKIRSKVGFIIVGSGLLLVIAGGVISSKLGW